MHVQSCCFANLNPFSLPFSLPSRRRCLSFLIFPWVSHQWIFHFSRTENEFISFRPYNHLLSEKPLTLLTEHRCHIGTVWRSFVTKVYRNSSSGNYQAEWNIKITGLSCLWIRSIIPTITLNAYSGHVKLKFWQSDFTRPVKQILTTRAK